MAKESQRFGLHCHSALPGAKVYLCASAVISQSWKTDCKDLEIKSPGPTNSKMSSPSEFENSFVIEGGKNRALSTFLKDLIDFGQGFFIAMVQPTGAPVIATFAFTRDWCQPVDLQVYHGDTWPIRSVKATASHPN